MHPTECLWNLLGGQWSQEQSGEGHFQGVSVAPARLLPSLGSELSPGSGSGLCLPPKTALDSARDKQCLQVCLWGLSGVPRGLRIMNHKSYFTFPSMTACNALSFSVTFNALKTIDVDAMVIPT